MNTDRVDVETLPEIKISNETLEILPQFDEGNPGDTRAGITWKRTVNRGTSEAAVVICRWKAVTGGVNVEMMRPVVTGSVVLPNLGGYKRMRR